MADNRPPSTSNIADHDDTESLLDALDEDDREKEQLYMRIEVLEKQLENLRNRSVDFDNEEHEDQLDAKENTIAKQLLYLKKKLVEHDKSAPPNFESLSDLLIVHDTGSKLLDEMITERLLRKIKDPGGPFDRCLDRDEVIQMCKECRTKEKTSAIPTNRKAFGKFTCEVLRKIIGALTRYRAEYHDFDDYVNVDEINTLKADPLTNGSSTQGQLNATMKQIEELMENNQEQTEFTEDGENCTTDAEDITEGVEIADEQEIMEPEVADNEVDDPTLKIGHKLDLHTADTKEDDSFCEILDDIKINETAKNSEDGSLEYGISSDAGQPSSAKPLNPEVAPIQVESVRLAAGKSDNIETAVSEVSDLEAAGRSSKNVNKSVVEKADKETSDSICEVLCLVAKQDKPAASSPIKANEEEDDIEVTFVKEASYMEASNAEVNLKPIESVRHVAGESDIMETAAPDVSNPETADKSSTNAEKPDVDKETSDSVREIVDHVPMHVELVISSPIRANEDEEDIQILSVKEASYIEPINTEKNDYVWRWLEKCCAEPDADDDEPELKRARIDNQDPDDYVPEVIDIIVLD